MRSFADPETHFRVVRSETPVSVDGFAMGEPTGEIECADCGASHLNIDEIPHAPHCSQRFVKSRFWQEAATDD